MSYAVRVIGSRPIFSKCTTPVDPDAKRKDLYTFKWIVFYQVYEDNDFDLLMMEQEIVESFEGGKDPKHIFDADNRTNIGYIEGYHVNSPVPGRCIVEISCYGLFGSSATNLEEALRKRLEDFIYPFIEPRRERTNQ